MIGARDCVQLCGVVEEAVDRCLFTPREGENSCSFTIDGTDVPSLAGRKFLNQGRLAVRRLS